MGKIPAGITGGVKGKVGGVVGQSWHGINYIKSYTIPTNPQTSGQQTQRGKMTLLQEFSKNLLTAIIHVFWNPIAEYKSGIHLWLSDNLLAISSSTDYPNILISKGALLDLGAIGLPTAVYSSVNGTVTITFDDSVSGNANANDNVGAYVYDDVNKYGYISVGDATRGEGEVVVDVPSGLSTYSFRCYIFAYRSEESGYFMSATNYVAVSA